MSTLAKLLIALRKALEDEISADRTFDALSNVGVCWSTVENLMDYASQAKRIGMFDEGNSSLD